VQALRHRLRRLSLIAFLAIFGFALAPTLSHALAAANPWAELCSAAADGKAPAPAQGAAHLEHCPLCGPGTGAAPLPVRLALTIAPPGGAVHLPALFLHAPRTLHAWTAAQPRAPPSQT